MGVRDVSDPTGEAFEGFVEGDESVGKDPTAGAGFVRAVGSLYEIPQSSLAVDIIQKSNGIAGCESAYDLGVETGLSVEVNLHGDGCTGGTGVVTWCT